MYLFRIMIISIYISHRFVVGESHATSASRRDISPSCGVASMHSSCPFLSGHCTGCWKRQAKETGWERLPRPFSSLMSHSSADRRSHNANYVVGCSTLLVDTHRLQPWCPQSPRPASNALLLQGSVPQQGTHDCYTVQKSGCHLPPPRCRPMEWHPGISILPYWAMVHIITHPSFSSVK